MNFRFRIKDKLYVFHFSVGLKVFNIPTLFTIGITNEAKNRKFVLFADYDEVNYDVVLEDYNYIQQKYEVGPAVILTTSEVKSGEGKRLVGNYHLIVPTKFEFSELRKILNDLRCDNHFKVGWKYQFRHWVLRIGPKISLEDGKIVKQPPKLKSVIYNYTDREGSYAHIRFLKLYYGVKNLEKYYKKIDDNKVIPFIRYVTK